MTQYIYICRRAAYRIIFGLIIFLNLTGISYSNNSVGFNQYNDTILLRTGEFIIYDDSAYYANKDTLIIVPANTPYTTTYEQNLKAKSVYDSLYLWAEKRPFINNLLHMLVIQNSSNETQEGDNEKSESRFVEYSGKTIRNIRLAKADPFGPGINDTVFRETTSLETFLNKSHSKTRDKVIINNLLIKKGDVLDPYEISDNERILRDLPFIQDARILIVPISPYEVDILVLTKDQYSFGFGFYPTHIQAGVFDVYDQNLFGIGHRIQAQVFYDFQESPSWGYGANYSSQNLFGSFIKAQINYLNAFHSEQIGIQAEHKFVSPKIKYSYGFSNSVTYTNDKFDTLLYEPPVNVNPDSTYPLRYVYQDYWFGRAFKLAGERDRLIFSGRFINNHVHDRPDITNNEYHYLQKYELYLGSIAFSRENFYKMHLIYNFGKTEDIPYGALFEITGGWENNEFYDRYYTSLSLSHGKIYPRLGYLYLKASIGGLLEHDTFERGLFQAKVNYFSHLIPANRFKIRQFVNFDYTNGIRRYSDENIYIRNNNGIRGLWSYGVRGTQRLFVNLETVFFSPYYLAGFRFTFYTFADVGLIGESNNDFFHNPIHTGVGIGVRIRNENLSFKTLQIRLAIYPTLSADFTKRVLLDVSGERYYRPEGFNVNRPEILEFK